MNLEVLADEEAVAQKGAQFIAEQVLRAVAERGRASIALSGGTTPQLMFRHLAQRELPWQHVDLWQVDERVAPPSSPERNLAKINENLMQSAHTKGLTLHPMPVETAELAEGAAHYGELLRSVCGVVPILDVVHLGLGTDGHAASLFEGDSALAVDDADVAITQTHQGFQRMTLTMPILNRARRVLWLVTGAHKATMVARLFHANPSTVAGRVCADRAFVFADVPAASAIRAPAALDDL